jgi:uncharacterized membrane protein YecN with MAPEG domain
MANLSIVFAVLLLAVLQYTFFGFMVGRARGKYGISAPIMSGHPEFERYLRVQLNTAELLVSLVPAMLIAGNVLAPWFVAIMGGIYLIGRQLYFRSYIADPKSRGLGFVLSLLPIMILVIGSLVSLIMQWMELGYIPVK